MQNALKLIGNNRFKYSCVRCCLYVKRLKCVTHFFTSEKKTVTVTLLIIINSNSKCNKWLFFFLLYSGNFLFFCSMNFCCKRNKLQIQVQFCTMFLFFVTVINNSRNWVTAVGTHEYLLLL